MKLQNFSTVSVYTAEINGSFELKMDEQNSGLDKKLKEDIQKGEVSGKSISGSYLFEFGMRVSSYTKSSYSFQNSIFDGDEFKKLIKELDASKLGYDGKPIDELSSDEAKDLLGEEGFFGVKKTAQRIADFVINGSAGDINMLKAGRDGAVRGMRDAENAWGQRLFDISYKTLDKALELIDKKIGELGGNALDIAG